MKKLTLRKVRLISFVGLLLVLILMTVGKLAEIGALEVIGFALAFAALGFMFIFHRCPKCKSYLRTLRFDFCPYCGHKLDE